MVSTGYQESNAAEMSVGTGIEWTGVPGYLPGTWNWALGCHRVSVACDNCYSIAGSCRCEAFRLKQYKGLTYRNPETGRLDWTGKVSRNSDKQFYALLHKRKPVAWFTLSMGDFFYEDYPPEWRAEALDIISRTPHHLYMILTKRPALAKRQLQEIGLKELPGNCWLGVTCEDHRVVGRIKQLRRIPATRRFLSVEPMTALLGRVDLAGIDWVITGGESGPRARPINPDWVREVRDQCTAAHVAFFHKQWGKPKFNPLAAQCPAGEKVADFIKRVDSNGKGGALLDGKLWRQFPVP
jgi:protein gp37